MLRERIGALLEHHCHLVDPASVPRRTLWQRLTRPLLFHVLRRFPRWAGLLPAHTPRTALLRPPGTSP